MARLSLTETDLNAANQKFTEFVENVNEQIVAFIETVRESVQKTQYDPIAKHGQTIVKLYNDTALAEIDRICTEWHDSESSYGNMAKIRHLGESSEEIAVKFAETLLDAVKDGLKQVDDIENPTGAVEIDNEQDFEDLQTALKTVTNQIEEITEQAKSQFEKEAEENTAFQCLQVPINAISVFMKDSFCQVAEKSTAQLKEMFETDAGNMQSNVETSTTETIAQATQSAENLSTEVLAEIENLFND
ncbi:MAG: hypothetical protein FWG68_10360 [Defluviitaleaceae bacterium]|nr:hypothetical protein [Defluviitaleaceae bacterium]